MTIISRLRAAWSAIMDVTGEQPDVAAPNTQAALDAPVLATYTPGAVDRTIEAVYVDIKAALVDFAAKVAAHDSAKAIADDAAKVVYTLKCEAEAVKSRAAQVESDMAADLARAEDWLTKAL